MDNWSSWHSVNSAVYHSDVRCRTGNNVEEEHLASGRGERRQCIECRRLGGDATRNEVDADGATFDRRLSDGTTRRFLWGVATAGQQVEGSLDNNEWSSYATSPFQRMRVAELGDAGGTQTRLEPAGDALGHWHRKNFEDDLDRAQALGVTAYRLSVEWSRVEPNPPAWVASWIDTRADLSTREIAHDLAGPIGPAAFDNAALQRYVEMIEAIQARGMEPIVTLNHMTVPNWVLQTPLTAALDDPASYDERTAAGSTLPFTVLLRGSVEDGTFRGTLRGWETRATSAAFVQYAREVVAKLSGVRWWLTFNEPIATMIGSSYLAGAWPPGFIGAGSRALRVYRNLILAHVAVYDVIHEVLPDAMVGCSQWMAAARPATQTIAQRIFVGDNEAATNQWIFFHNHYFLDAVVRGDDVFGATGSEDVPDIWRKASRFHQSKWAGHADFIALQYYRSVQVWHDQALALSCPSAGGRFTLDVKRDSGTADDLKEHLSSDLGWTIEPQGLSEVLNETYERYGLPVLITENGIGESQDRNRAPFIVAHLQSVLASTKAGADVLGYVHWTIADNWEWTFGYLPQARFGLYTVDRAAAGKPRYLTTGALCLAAATATSGAVGVSVGGDLLSGLVRRFGSIDPAGTRLIRPVRQSHAQWLVTVDTGEMIELVLVPLHGSAWLGLAYEVALQHWTLLRQVAWRATGSGTGRITFSLPSPTGDRDFTAVTMAATSAGSPELTGDVVTAAGTSLWTGVRRVMTQVFRGRGDPTAPTHLAFTRFEPTAPWRAASASGSDPWAVCRKVRIVEDARSVTCTLQDGRVFTGTVSGRAIAGSIGGSAWTGTALLDDIPFA
jgi:beta-glucosidase/6-phospho-beta-glucosidase/beta-galactosidase